MCFVPPPGPSLTSQMGLVAPPVVLLTASGSSPLSSLDRLKSATCAACGLGKREWVAAGGSALEQLLKGSWGECGCNLP